MEWLLIVAALYVVGLFVPWGEYETFRERLTWEAVPSVIFGGFTAATGLVFAAGFLWLLVAAVTGVLGLN